jgi:hypothetical protein
LFGAWGFSGHGQERDSIGDGFTYRVVSAHADEEIARGNVLGKSLDAFSNLDVPPPCDRM